MRFNSSGVVKHYNFKKHFGFFVPDAPLEGDNSDVMVHRNVLRRAGIPAMLPGSRITCVVEKRETGLCAVEVLGLQSPPDDNGACLRSSRRGTIHAETGWLDGEVKFYSLGKGYGIVMVEGRPDAFVHAEALQKYGITEFQSGDAVQVRLGRVPTGLVVVGIRQGRARAHG